MPGSCWGTSNGNKNVWFRFQATTPYATVQVKTGSVYGNMQRAQMAMWNASLNEVVCVGDIVGQGITEMAIDTLTVGSWYWISVDDDYVSGSFTLCLDDEISFDFLAGAEEIPHDMGCSSDAAYTNLYGTPDEVPGSCWGTSNTLKNVWFKFQALSRFLTFEVKTGSIYGNMQRAQMAVFNSAGQEVSCIPDIVGQGTTTLSADTLTPGDWYYIAVDDDYVSGSFTICISDQPTYNYWEGAIELPHNFGCSANQAYTNLAATPDMAPGSCWGTSNTLKNVWFKFQATTTNVTVDIKTGSVYGNMQRAQMALWNDAFQQVACVGDLLAQGTTTMSMDTLTVGNWYYISVDDDYVSGTFSLCLSNKASYDFFGGALELQHNGGCSADAAYSNYLATADRSMASCWTGVDPVDNKNVWFKFQAITTDVTLTIRNYSVYGNMRYPQAALWNSAGGEIKCLPRTLNSSTSTLSYDGLVVGEWYYISVDDANTSGTFTLCIDDALDYDYKAGAYEIVSPIRWCSGDAQFNNYFGTPDELPGTCWAGGENKNVWFRFTAISSNVNIDVKNGTTFGNLQDLQASLWNSAGVELACATTEGNTTPIHLSSDTLTIGNTYYISVDDSQTPGSFTICVDADPLNAVLVGTDVTCNGDADGTITVTPQGGTGVGYGYTWTRNGVPYVGGSSITGLDPATYVVIVTDLGDPATTVVLSYVVTEDPPLTLSLSKTDAGCPGNADGSVTATPGGGSGMGFTYTWYRNDILMVDITPSLLSVDSAEYRVIVTDFGSTACTITDSIVVSNTSAASLAPTGINVTNDNTCPGVIKTLTVTGGSLGDAAVWNWSTDPAFGSSSGIGASIGVNPAVNTTYYVRAEGLCNTTASVNTLVIVKVPSTDPAGVTVTNDNTCVGTVKNLTVVGGSLGTGATWEWYTDAGFSVPAGTGVTITVDPAITTTYYVRAEGDCGNSTAVSAMVTVRTPSTDPAGISVTNDNTCPGISKTLTVLGGSLGTGADWYWYSDPGLSILIGSGGSVAVDPLTTTTYYVRAQGDCGNSAAVSAVVTVRVPSTDPSSVSVANNNSCAGTTKNLTVLGGSLGTGADWFWYSDAALTMLAGTGVTIGVDPAVTTTYYVRAEGDCNNTSTASAVVNVKEASVAPTGINISNDNTCFGTSKTLTVVGGSLGANAQWHWYSDAGLTVPVGTGVSVVVDPAVTTTYYVRAEGDCNLTTAASQSVTVKTASVAPTGITVLNNNTCQGNVKTLSVTGGSLGDGAIWNWSDDAGFSSSIGTGASVMVDPAVTTTYYVRAEGDCNITASVSTVVTVKVSSTDPTGITVTNDNTCPGVSKDLTVVGGSLGTGATWVWSTNAAFSTTVATGVTITVNPATTRTYYVRAEGDCNITASVNAVVTVKTLSTDPTSITVTNDNSCPGVSKDLTVVGGSLGTGATWEWYSDAAFSVPAGTGVTITVDPATTTTYYVRAEGDCGNSAAVSAVVTVKVPSTDPTGITVTNDNSCPGVSKDLTVVGGSLGTGATWEWYSDAVFSVPAGTGVTITVDPAVTTTYYVRAEGDCGNSAAVSTVVTVPTASTDPTGIDLTNDNTCQGDAKTLTVTGGSLGDGADWFWYSDSDLTISEGTGESIVVDPDSSTTYYVRAEGICNESDTVGQLVTVRMRSVAPEDASADIGEFCIGAVEFVTLSYSGGFLGTGADAFWYTDSLFIEASIASGNHVTIPAPAETTVYYIRFEGECNTTDAVSVQVLVNPLPVPAIDGEMMVCEPVEAVYSVSGLTGSVFSWSVTGGSILGNTTGEIITVEWSGEGTGTVSVTETAPGGCIAVADSSVIKFSSPPASEIQGGIGMVCSGDTGIAYYIDGLSGSLFEWTVETGSVSREYGDSILVDWAVTPGSYLITVVETSEHGCVGDTIRRTVQVEGPGIDLGGDTYVCEGETYNIDLSGEYSSYLWHDGSIGSSFSTGDEGWIVVHVGDESGCIGADSLYLTVNPLPMVDLGSDTSLCGDLGFVLDAGPDGTIYTWSTGDNSQEITIFQGEKQEIGVVVEDEFGCISRDTIVIDECNAEFYFRDIPTAITPNDDGTNDTWNIEKLAGYSQAEVEIYNRWGTLVWKSEPGYSLPWDGRDMHGNWVPMDSYHFVIRLKVGSVDRITGIITVIR
jgi:gliding motility-associated-like protein